MGTLSAVGGIAALFLPETLWKHLPNTLEEGEEFGSKFKICSCPQEDLTLVCNDEVNEGEVRIFKIRNPDCTPCYKFHF